MSHGKYELFLLQIPQILIMVYIHCFNKVLKRLLLAFKRWSANSCSSKIKISDRLLCEQNSSRELKKEVELRELVVTKQENCNAQKRNFAMININVINQANSTAFANHL